MRLAFTKMQGTGNDFVVIDCTEMQLADPSALARRLCDRRFGIGADQMLLVLPSPTPDADFRMAIFNADGSEVEMCGNGVRCFARYVRAHRLTEKNEIVVHTDAGLIRPLLQADGMVRVDMGKPILEGEQIPSTFHGPVTSQPLTVHEQPFAVTCVSMGNPHCVVFVDDVAAFPVTTLGPGFEHHRAFPRRVNTEFVEVLDAANLRMRVWERGSGETMACGTGASAALVAAVLNGRTERRAKVHLAGGTLFIEWDAATNHVFMTGPAEEVFNGIIDVPIELAQT